MVSHKDDDRAASPPGHPGMPGWVKVLVVIALVLAALLLVGLLVGGEHGPGRHLSEPMGEDGPAVLTSAGRA